jgi:hypothetical protein
MIILKSEGVPAHAKRFQRFVLFNFYPRVEATLGWH